VRHFLIRLREGIGGIYSFSMSKGMESQEADDSPKSRKHLIEPYHIEGKTGQRGQGNQPTLRVNTPSTKGNTTVQKKNVQGKRGIPGTCHFSPSNWVRGKGLFCHETDLYVSKKKPGLCFKKSM